MDFPISKLQDSSGISHKSLGEGWGIIMSGSEGEVLRQITMTRRKLWKALDLEDFAWEVLELQRAV